MLLNELQDLIIKGIKNNIVVYDCNARVGTLTKRLLFLMKNVAKQNKHKLSKIYIPSDVYPNFTKADLVDGCVLNPWFFGVYLEVSTLLDGELESVASQFYMKHEGHLHYLDQSLIIGVCTDRYIILGATNKSDDPIYWKKKHDEWRQHPIRLMKDEMEMTQ